MPQYELRMNCEYVLIVKADSEEEAERIGGESDPTEWDNQDWSGLDITEIEGDDEEAV